MNVPPHSFTEGIDASVEGARLRHSLAHLVQKCAVDGDDSLETRRLEEGREKGREGSEV